jgi:ankyrin repeat protein
MKVEVPRALQSLGVDPRVRTREDAGAKAFLLCKEVVGFCAPVPTSEACRPVLARYGFGAGDYRPSAEVALFDAALAGRTDTVRKLLAEGADVNWRNAAGWTPLMIAAAEKHLDTVQVLLAAKADPNQRNAYGRTALMFASSYGQLEIVRALLAAGADPNIVANDTTGWTALVAASVAGHTAVVDALLKGNADPRLLTKEGRRAIDYARANGHADVVRLLESSAGPS